MEGSYSDEHGNASAGRSTDLAEYEVLRQIVELPAGANRLGLDATEAARPDLYVLRPRDTDGAALGSTRLLVAE